MKILYSCLSRSWGGMEMYTLTCMHQLIDRGHEVHLLAFPDSKLFEEAKERKLTVFPIKASGYFHPAEIVGLKILLQKNRYELIHTQASKDLWVLVPALRISGSQIPLYLTKQVGSFIVKKDALHRWIYNRVTRIFAISRVIQKNLADTTPVNPARIELLHNAIDTAHFNPAHTDGRALRKEFAIGDNEILIGMLARFSKGKGHEEMIEAAGILNQKHSGVKYLIVGEASKGEDDYAEGIKKLARDAKLENMIFTGFRKDVRTVLAALDIFVFPSHNEAFGIALAEALSMGVPSVCSNSDGILDIAVDGVTSLLFQVKDGRNLAEKISRLISDQPMRTRFSEASRRRAVEHFDLKVLTERVLEFYHKDIRS